MCGARPGRRGRDPPGHAARAQGRAICRGKMRRARGTRMSQQQITAVEYRVYFSLERALANDQRHDMPFH